MADTVDLRHRIQRCPECGEQFSPAATFCPFDGHKLEARAWDPTKDPLANAVVGERYEVVTALGEGGMGTVYDVRHMTLGRHFALKVLRRDLAKDGALAQRFVDEARATARIHHPHVVGISDFGELDDGRPYFVMELLAGKTLGDVMREAPPGPAVIARICSRVADAMEAAHAAGVIHRDLKPDNVFVLDAKGDDVRVVDFGAALVMGKKRVTKTGVVFGTPHYMSPEQAGGQPIDRRADVYALGIILYRMLAGALPFEADTFMGVITKHMFVRPEPPGEMREEVLRRGVAEGGAPLPPAPRDESEARTLAALEIVCLRALEKNPDKRYQSMAELSSDVERALTAPHTLSAPKTSDDRPPRSRVPWIVAGVASLLAVVAIVVAASLRSPVPATGNASATPSGELGDGRGAAVVTTAPASASATPPPATIADPPASAPTDSAASAPAPRPPVPRLPRTKRPHGSDTFADPWAK